MCKSVNILVFWSYQCCAGALKDNTTIMIKNKIPGKIAKFMEYVSLKTSFLQKLHQLCYKWAWFYSLSAKSTFSCSVQNMRKEICIWMPCSCITMNTCCHQQLNWDNFLPRHKTWSRDSRAAAHCLTCPIEWTVVKVTEVYTAQRYGCVCLPISSVWIGGTTRWNMVWLVEGRIIVTAQMARRRSHDLDCCWR